MSTELGSFLRRILEEKGLTQKELSRLSGLSESQISRLASGERGKSPSIDVFKKLAKGLGMPVKLVIKKSGYWSDEYNDVNDDIEDDELYGHIARAKNLPDENRKVIANMLDNIIDTFLAQQKDKKKD